MRPGTAGPALAALGLLATLVSGCSGGQDEYCASLADAKEQLTHLAAEADGGSAAQAPTDTLTPTLDVLRGLRSDAPDELKDEWDTVVFAYEDLAEAADRAGVDPADLSAGHAPRGLPPSQARRLAAVASKLESSRVLEASKGIEDQARQVCGVDFDT